MAEDPLFARFGQTFPAGAVLFREDEPGDTMFVVRRGSVRISKAAKDGDKTLALLGPGEMLGELAILNGRPRTATAVAETDLDVLVLDAKRFEQMVATSAEIAVRLIKKLAARLDDADALIEILVHRDARARVLLGLTRQLDLAGRRTDAGILLPLDRSALARELGVSIDEATDTLARLQRLAIVEETKTEDGHEGFLVRDPTRLREFYAYVEKQSG